MTETAAMTMTELLSTIGDVFSTAIGWVGTVADIITDFPILVIGAVFGFVCFSVGMFKRLFYV